MESQNPFEAPKVDPDIPSLPASQQPWFAVGTKKLVVMTIVTIGVYTIYWFERNYRFQKRALGENTWPLARGLFSVFFAHTLFRRIAAAAFDRDIRFTWTASSMGSLYVLVAIMSQSLSRITDGMELGPAAGLFALAEIVAICALAVPLVQVQATVNKIQEQTQARFDRNDHYTGWNWLAIILGGGILVLFLFGLVLDFAT